MALKFPVLVKMTSSTTGTGTYTYAEPAQAGYRTPTDAIADSSMASGDEVTYVAIDTGALGSANLFEFGRGVLNNTAKTLTRATVYQSSNAGAAVSWGAGTRDLYVVTAGALFAALAEANVFTANQEIEKASPIVTLDALSGDPQIQFRLNGTLRMELGMAAAGTVAYWDFFDAAAVLKARYLIGDNRAEFATTAVATGTPFERFPSGTELLFGTSPPTGWTRQNETEDFLPRLAKAADTVGTTGGSWTISGLSSSGGVTGSHALVLSEIPSHSHLVSYSQVQVQSGGGVASDVSTGASTVATSSSGSGGGHAHTLPAIAADGAWRPRFKIFARATKN